MKKSFVIVLSALLTVIFCSCGIPAQKRECFAVPEDFICDIFITNNGEKYEGKLQRQDKIFTLTVTSPESLDGLTVRYADGEYEASFEGGNLKLSPTDDFFMGDIIESIEKAYSDGYIECTQENGAYTVKQNNWKLVFSD